MADAYDIGQQIRWKGTFQDPANLAFIDGDTVVCHVLSPAGIETNPAANRDSLGHYSAVTTLSSAGTWQAWFTSTGSVVAATPTDAIFVRPR